MIRIDMEALSKEDRKWKPPQTDEMATKLAELWNDTASALTVNYMRGLGLGNKKNKQHPFMAAMTRRMTEALSVCYAVPATRWLVDPKTRIEYSDNSPEMVALNEAFEQSAYDLLWKNIDGLRNLFRTVVVEWTEDDETGAVSVYVFGPHVVKRWPDPNAPSSIERDRMVALQLRDAPDDADKLYRVWTRDESGRRAAVLVNGKGDQQGEQPFSGMTSPYEDTLPLQIVFDDHPMGAAWLPVPESRVAWALGVNAAVNDLALLIQLEAHTNKVFRSEQTGQAPREIGPDDVIEVVGEKADFKTAGNTPHIGESSAVVDQMLRLWALGEFLPGDTFTATSAPATGQALKVKQADLAARRARQALLVPVYERAAWRRYSSIHNAHAQRWDATPVAAGARLRAAPGRSWQPLDPVELQNVGFRDLATGFMSRIDYAMERYQMTRSEAIAHLERVRADNERFPLSEFQNAGALSKEQAAAGPGSATKTPGTMNPDIGTSTEGASVTQAVISRDAS